MWLEGKVAVVYGGGGAIGGAVARAFAREGARVHLAGRTQARLDAVAAEIVAAGGQAECAALDVLDEEAVEHHASAVAEATGRFDVMLNAVGISHVQGTPLLELGYDEYAHPLEGYTRSNFLTARAAARRMVRQGTGVILMLSTPGARMAGGGFMGYGAACAAVEAMTRHLAGELGPHGVRAVCLRSDAIPEALGRHSHTAEVFRKAAQQAGMTVDGMLAERARSATLLQRLPTLQQLADAAVFAASDRAGAVTACLLNVTCGSVVDV
ncbi:SDR family oxidoreductase [Schlegelella sp. S2-27]|uniref:SDR family oxidoreductase n=1 Tax=Caldimonas mangrovi TaxID=2944811 RepID=A0ABT0YJP8_9BURK|nr:SDR family oxidoreductase [Caldimonas mangrovi]MCM5678954.1 SDR family oxidoreductase [Caldimonas mangrovi]